MISATENYPVDATTSRHSTEAVRPNLLCHFFGRVINPRSVYFFMNEVGAILWVRRKLGKDSTHASDG